MSKTPILGAGTNFIRTNGAGNGYIASFITDAGDPSFLNIPGGNWNLEFYFQSSSSGGSPQFYGEIYKVSATNVFTLVASGSANPEGITNGTTVDQYFTSIPMPQTSLLITDRLAIRIYVITGGRTITLHTENGNLCEVLTTFTTGLTALNGLTTQVQSFATGTSGTDFGISSATSTHTFNLPTASAANRGALSSTDWSTFNGKFTLPALTSGSVLFSNGSTIAQDNANLFWDDTNNRLGIGTNAPNSTFHLASSITAASAIARGGNITSTLVAAANSDVLVGLEINPTFTLGAFTSVNSVGLLVRNGKLQVLNGWTGNNPYADVASFGNPVGSVDQFISVDSLASKQAGIVFRSQLGNRWTQYREATNSNMIFLNASTGTSALSLFYSSANVGINTTTDAGFKLDVNGTARVKGTGTTSATSSFTVQNSAGTEMFRIYDNSGIVGQGARFGNVSVGNYAFHGTNTNEISVNAGNLILQATQGTGVVIGSITLLASAVLQVNSTTKGFLPPRMTNAQRLAIATPAVGLMVYCTDVVEGLYINKSTGWTFVV